MNTQIEQLHRIDGIEIDEPFLPVDIDCTYTVEYKNGRFKATLEQDLENVPKTLHYVLTKEIEHLTKEERAEILHYRGLDPDDDVTPMDVFLHGKHILCAGAEV